LGLIAPSLAATASKKVQELTLRAEELQAGDGSHAELPIPPPAKHDGISNPQEGGCIEKNSFFIFFIMRSLFCGRRKGDFRSNHLASFAYAGL
jgi:hypothetical protein